MPTILRLGFSSNIWSSFCCKEMRKALNLSTLVKTFSLLWVVLHACYLIGTKGICLSTTGGESRVLSGYPHGYGRHLSRDATLLLRHNCLPIEDTSHSAAGHTLSSLPSSSDLTHFAREPTEEQRGPTVHAPSGRKGHKENRISGKIQRYISRNNDNKSLQKSVTLSDFQDTRLTSILKRHWLYTPPFTKAYVTLSAALTVYAYAVLQNAWPSILRLHWMSVCKGQIWRPLTCFLFLGNFGISYLLTLQFVWSYMSSLERLYFRNPEVFFTMLLFGMGSLLLAYPILGLPTHMIGHNLAIFLVYVWSRLHEGQSVSIMDLFELKAEYLPWFFLLQGWLFEGGLPLTDLLGMGFGVLYYWLGIHHGDKTPEILRIVFSKPSFRKFYQQFSPNLE